MEINEILAIKGTDVSVDLIIDLFGNKPDKDGKLGKQYKPSEKITVPKGYYHNNSEPIKTTIGRWVVNRFLFDNELYDVMGYYNETITGGNYKDIVAKLGNNLIEGKITPEHMIAFLDKMQHLGFATSIFLTPSLTEKTNRPLKSVIKERDRLYKENEEAIKNGDAIVAADIEKKLVKQAEAELKGDSGLELYSSGSKASIGNNYKALYITKGPVRDLASGDYEIIKSNYMDGIKRSEMAASANSMISGQYPKSVEPMKSGYMTKKCYAAFQSLVTGKQGSDCGSKLTVKITLTKDIIGMFKFRYIVENGKLVLLTPDILSRYVGKTVSLRDPMFCGGVEGTKFCSKCFGEYFYKLDISAVGLTSTKMTAVLLNKCMKKFHDSSIKLNYLTDEDLENIVL